MKNGVRQQLREVFREQQAREIAAAPRCGQCGLAIGHYVTTRLTVWTPRGGVSHSGGLETDADLGLCCCPTSANTTDEEARILYGDPAARPPEGVIYAKPNTGDTP